MCPMMKQWRRAEHNVSLQGNPKPGTLASSLHVRSAPKFEVVSKWFRNGFEMVSKWFRDGFEMDPGVTPLHVSFKSPTLHSETSRRVARSPRNPSRSGRGCLCTQLPQTPTPTPLLQAHAGDKDATTSRGEMHSLNLKAVCDCGAWVSIFTTDCQGEKYSPRKLQGGANAVFDV